MTSYVAIVFQQGEEGREVTDALYNVEGVVQHGVTEESLLAAIDYLAQWACPGDEVLEEQPWCDVDDVWRSGNWVVYANPGLGYVGLAEEVQS